MTYAAPSQAQLILQLRRIMALYRQVRAWGGGGVSGGDMLDVQAGISAAIGAANIYGDQVASAVSRLRGQLAGIFADSAPLQAHLRDWAVLIGIDADAPLATILDAWYGYCVETPVTVAPRTFSYGTPSASPPANIGDGVIKRITVDSRGYQRQGSWGRDTWEARCVADSQTGAARNSEVIELRTLPSGRDALDTTTGSVGAGIRARVTASDPRSLPMTNLTLDDYSGASAGALAAITGWTSENGVSAGSYEMVSGTSYLPARSAFDAVRALRCSADDTLTQRFDEAGVTLAPQRAYYSALAYYSSGSGTLRLRVGAVSASVVLSAGQADWSVLELSQASGSYLRALSDDPMTAAIAVSDLSGSVLIGPAWIAAPYTEVGGTAWLVRPGPEPFRAGSWRDDTGDYWTWSDTVTESVIQRELSRLLPGYYLPYAVSAGAATILEPS
jgi:hypothetical protein